MARNNNKINLPTNTTDIKTLAKYLKYIDARGVVSKDVEQDVFAEVKINESKKTVTDPARDTHTKSTLKLFGLIDVADDDSFSLSSLGKEVLNYYFGGITHTEEERVALMLKVLCRWEINDKYGRHIHPGFILMKLLCDSDLNYYITNHELSHFTMSSKFMNDDQYDEIKQCILEFRSQKLAYDEDWKKSKSDIFLSTFDTNWGLLTRTSRTDVLNDRDYRKLLKQWADYAASNSDSEDVVDDLQDDFQDEIIGADEKAFVVNECRLNGLAAYVARLYLSLLEGVNVRDYLSYFTSSSQKLYKMNITSKIYYGCPGTGKSFNINGDLVKVYPNEGERKEYVYRTTFHPDTDYASFVGSYKPTSKMNFLLSGKNATEEQILDCFFESKDETKYNGEIKARYFYEYLKNAADIKKLKLSSTTIAKKLKERKFDKTAYEEASLMQKVYEWLKSDGYLTESQISYQFIPQVFTNAYVKAWKEFEKENPKPIYLVIEEINRGNCAQIFGDLFQLLDRDKKTGISEYSIKADNDLADYLEKALGVDHEGIKNRELRFPSNLIIYATMNTSDQSLFPMDSAFKRRWDWEYVPIDYETGDSATYTITIDNETYKWVEFLKVVNDKIRNLTHSEDKQMGNYFIKKSVNQDEFINKVMFYLWDEVCKDEYNTERNFLRYKEGDVVKEFSFTDLFSEDKTKILKGFITKLKEDNLNKNKEE